MLLWLTTVTHVDGVRASRLLEADLGCESRKINAAEEPETSWKCPKETHVMPILAQQPDISPSSLLDETYLDLKPDHSWWVLSVRPRTEKKLMTRLGKEQVDFYCPLIEKRYRSPAGRIRSSFLPVFTSYVLLFGDWDQRYFAYTTDYVVSDREVVQPQQLAEFLRDLRQIRGAILAGAKLTPEAHLEPGERVSVKAGPFKGYEGTILRREGKTRLLLRVDFLEQGVSMEIDECQLQRL